MLLGKVRLEFHDTKDKTIGKFEGIYLQLVDIEECLAHFEASSNLG